MNPTDPSDPLLDALLADPAALDAMHSAGRAALRRRRHLRMMRVTVGSGAVAACLLFALRTPTSRDKRANDSPVSPPLAENEVRPPLPDAPPAVSELNDDELLRQFPPGTCTIAEVDGRKMLVFLGEEARAKYQR